MTNDCNNRRGYSQSMCMHFCVFASNSQVRTLQLHLNLQTTKKGNKSMEDYITYMIDIANALALAGDKVSDKDLAMFVLGGLESDYDPLVTAITTRPSNERFSIDDIQGIFLNHEIRLASNIAPSVENSFSVNYTNRQRYNSNQNSYVNNNKNQNFNLPKQPSKVTPYSYMICQICEKRGHIASSCYSRFNKSFNIGQNKQAHIVFEEEDVGSDTTMWFPDSGASTHITSDFEILSLAAPYEGGDKVTTANGTDH